MTKLFSLDHFGFMSVTGKDALDFLQGYTTCDLLDLKENQSRPGAICNIKGRMVSNFRAIPIDEGFLLRMSASLVEPTLDFLKKYIVFSKAEMTDLTHHYHCYGTTTTGVNFPQELNTFVALENDLVVRVEDEASRFEIWSTESKAATEDIKPWLSAEIRAGLAWLDEDSTDSYLPQSFNMHAFDGISFEKGCYLGQEIVARMQYRGELTKRLHSGSASHNVSEGDKIIRSDQHPVGTIGASCDQEFLAIIETKASEDLIYHLADGSDVSVSDLYHN